MDSSYGIRPLYLFMKQVAVFVDAGYFFAQGSIALTGNKGIRGDATLNIKKLLEALTKFATSLTGNPLLRIYWYDGTSTGPSPQHIALAFEPNVKMRLGFVNAVGQQKGVDSLIVTDMITLARNNAMSDAVLLSGDEDLRVGVQQAQEFGVRVHLLGICSHPNNQQRSQSQFLLQESDTTHLWTEKEIEKFLSYRVKSELPKIDHKTAPVSHKNTLSEIAAQYAQEIESQLIVGLLENYNSSKRIPPDVDRPLLGRAKTGFGILTQDQKSEIRKEFVAALSARLPKSPTTKI